MPLPPALQARLAKRGLFENKEKNEMTKKRSIEEEEVIAESYDEPNESKENGNQINNEFTSCPNKNNQFHECSSFCTEKFGNKKFQHHPVMEKRRARMLKIYPLPPNWVEVPDFNTNRYYYWNTETDQVCWISPSHPKAKIEYPRKVKLPEIETKSPFKEAKKVDYNRKDQKKEERSKPKKNKKEEIDPMDPAAYSDIPRGTWSDGLEKQ
ncbi:Polyglutamine-binding 1 [Brachionus plicatilis]|uniref:Polyglutamine-binding 1 n=1 Tax=Brachionus plicatilis TaxID=10195 RepID=A0A3M7P769_BRAPC|nr:Polyglutamine-binding 1 [Brachionus plicatilis]